MKKAKRGIVLALVLMLVLLTGCQQKYPYTIQPDLDANAADQTVSNQDIKVSYPANQWLVGVEENTISMLDIVGIGGTAYVRKLNMETANPLSERDKVTLVAEMTEPWFGLVTVDLAELREMGGKSVIYIEATQQYTDEVIDRMLEGGALTEASIEEVGGRGALLELPPSYVIFICALVDGEPFLFNGGYEDDAGKQIVLDCLTTMITTAKAK